MVFMPDATPKGPIFYEGERLLGDQLAGYLKAHFGMDDIGLSADRMYIVSMSDGLLIEEEYQEGDLHLMVWTKKSGWYTCE